MPSKAIVLDANILVRTSLGKRVRQIIGRYSEDVSFFVPESAILEADECLQRLVAKHCGVAQKALIFLRRLADTREALAPGCPVWTEDTDVFGWGVASWMSRSVEMFRRE